ncbi:Arylsulphatase [Trichoderma citrinoviride]|uniref:Arylsulfatase n=1 Tax=Trichoderma citrinoviride TaxID=58853 RepID=A0A2T4BIW4_9HYPO|nr:Arylsulphatase [Trichoderma citrinoviride]PTB69211.1 Arylsulphatase [Trichoderma citrinoviride]
MVLKLTRAIFASSWLLSAIARADAAPNRPNIIFILTDDQDNHMGSLDYMPSVQKHLIHQGTTFEKHYCSTALCCPARVTLWTGQLAHNTNVTNVRPPYGGYPKFVQNGYNDHHLALWLQQSGYNTYYVGKLFNSHTVDNYDSPPVSGYSQSNFFLDPFTYQYYNVSTTINGAPPTNPVGKYSTDIVAESAQEFLQHALQDENSPFFITLAPIAPHSVVGEGSLGAFDPPQIAERHQGLFPEYKIPRTPNFNPDSPSGVNWVSKLPKQDDEEVDYNDEYQRLRLRSLQAVDEIVESVVDRLDKAGALENTFIFYTSDNGYHIGQHRLHPGKMCGFETDINVPLIVRGPGVPSQRITRVPSSHADLAPTILQIAGLEIDDKNFDGSPIDIFGTATGARSEHAAVEFWGLGLAESIFGRKDGPPIYPNNTYKGLRIEAEDYGFYYSVWCSNEKELYDMKARHTQADPGQVHNLLSPGKSLVDAAVTIGGEQWPLEKVVDRLDALMMVLKSCKQQTCIHPWKSLHPSGDVQNLHDALSTEYDEFYRSQVKVSFTSCESGYILESEGPQAFSTYEAIGDYGPGDEMYDPLKQQPLVNPNWSLWE